jgi:hypothetical protein
MSDKRNLEKFLQHMIADDKEAAAEYIAQVITSKANRMVNEDKKEDAEEEKECSDDKKEGTPEKEMDKTKPAIKDGKEGDTKAKKLEKVDAKKGEGKQPTKKEV